MITLNVQIVKCDILKFSAQMQKYTTTKRRAIHFMTETEIFNLRIKLLLLVFEIIQIILPPSMIK